ncbi:MAG: cyclic nucleotide-binding domain-containing protein [Myxococcota bacterium]
MVRDGVHLAQSEAELEAIYRFRYDVYVEEMGFFKNVADHENRRLVEPEDETARIWYAAEHGEVVGTQRMSWGGDAPFSERLIDEYQLGPFLEELPPEAMAVGERLMVLPRLRGSSLFFQLTVPTGIFIAEKRVQLVFGVCEPHLLNLYLSQGCRTFAKKNINAESGYLIPLVTVVEDVEYLRRIEAPTAATARDWGPDARIPECVQWLVDSSGVTSQRLSAPGEYRGQIYGALEELAENRLSALEGLSDEEAERTLGKSNIIDCAPRDRVVAQGSVTRNMFVVLEGTFEVRDGERLLRVLSPGDVFGEIAFLLERPRSADVIAATNGRILALSEGTLRKAIANDPEVAARLLLNVSKILCQRML